MKTKRKKQKTKINKKEQEYKKYTKTPANKIKQKRNN